MNSKNKKLKIVKFIMFIIVIIAMIGMTVYLFPVMKNLSTYEGQIAFKEKVNNSGVWGFLALICTNIFSCSTRRTIGNTCRNVLWCCWRNVLYIFLGCTYNNCYIFVDNFLYLHQYIFDCRFLLL